LGFWKNSKGFGVEMPKTGKNPLFLGTFWGFLKSSEEEKGPQITNLEKFYLVDILPTHQYGQLCLEEFFPSFSPFGR
jgi:hypothetical protein